MLYLEECMKRFPSLFIAALLLLLLGTVFTVSAEDSVIKLSGITTTDEHPNGCVDCHKVSGNDDFRLNVSLKEVAGHPPIDAMVKTLPNDCMTCHKAGAYAGALSTITHKSHYANPGENNFIAYYQGQCLECHSLNLTSGAMSVKSGPKNW